MRILIVGAGIAGTATAVALAKAGIRAEICEAYDRGSEGVGAWLTLASNGIDAAATLGLGDAVIAGGFPTPLMRMYTHRDRLLAEFPFGSPRRDGLQVHSVRRADLYAALRDAVAARQVPVTYSRRLVGIDAPDTGPVQAHFDDGSTTIADVLVGADGLRSATRAIIDPAAPPARYGGLLNTGGFAPAGVLPARYETAPGTLCFRFGRRCFLGHVSSPAGETWWFANPPSKRELSRQDLAAIDDHTWRETLHELFRGDDTPAAELIDATENIFAGWNTYDFPTVPTWHRNGMVIVGDAAHAVSPASGQGASLALEDAVTLARALRDATDVASALTRFETERRERVQKIVELGKRNGDGKSAGPLARVIRDRVVMPLVAARFQRQHTHPEAWVFDHHIGWDETQIT
ncbi:FAD-dependent oxidoreductase [uncultured Jatrophihabitans sp.]|uniref:FAD-dependent oxidoreductase n=1 Tax=uncultured Jatrophihabitans sp. TaxID=1610747 RepID=UPI0035C9E07B